MIPLRPSVLVSLLIVGGVLAALPFRRSLSVDSTDPSSPHVSPPPAQRSDLPQSLSISENGWGDRDGFDPSLAWQPLPMTVPGRHAPQLPQMPDSYYDVSFEIQEPRSLRSDRFPAAGGPLTNIHAPQLPDATASQAHFSNPSAPVHRLAPDHPFAASGQTAVRPHDRPAAALTREPDDAADSSGPAPRGDLASTATPSTAAASTTTPAAATPPPLPEQFTADDLITDRFIYTPLGRSAHPQASPHVSAQSSAASGAAAYGPASDGHRGHATNRATPASLSTHQASGSQQASGLPAAAMHRPAWAVDDPNRPKHYIREPD